MNLPTIKILVVNHEPVNRTLLELFLKNAGHSVISAETGELAIPLFKCESPDVVIIDVDRLEMSVYEITRQIKLLSKDYWTPVILVSELLSPEDQINGLQSGGDYYMIKPMNLSILACKIQAIQRIVAIQRALFDSLKSLKQYQDKTERELELARHMMQQLTRQEDLTDQGIRHFNIPAGAFSGDVIAVTCAASGLQYVLLADVTGHGLASALNAIPLIEAFFEYAENGSSLEHVCKAVNNRLHLILPPGYFVAAMLVTVDRKNRLLQVWNGGLPPAFFMTNSGDIYRNWTSRHLALGILNDSDFDATLESLSWDTPGQIIMFTDGLIEAASANGEVFGEARLLTMLRAASAEHRLTHVQLSLNAFLSSAGPHDDISFVAIDCH